MQAFYYDAMTGQCLGSFGPGTLLPAHALRAQTAPIDGRQVWMNDTWAWPLEMMRANILAVITQRYHQSLAKGLRYAGKVLQIREQDQINLIAINNDARWIKIHGTAWPSNFAWRMADNSFLPLPNPESMIALAEAAKVEVLRLRKVKWSHVDAVCSLTSSAELAAYNFETEW